MPLKSRFLAVALLLIAAACSQREAPPPAAHQAANCLPGERGYLRARLRGAINADVDWRDARLHCEGGARPDGRGLRVSFAGPLDAEGRRLRLVFGIAAEPGRSVGRNRPTNVTVIVEGEDQLYATQGDDKCTIESLIQQPLGDIGAGTISAGSHLYRVAARGYCIDPAATLQGDGRLYINRFDFAGTAQFEDSELDAPDTRT